MVEEKESVPFRITHTRYACRIQICSKVKYIRAYIEEEEPEYQQEEISCYSRNHYLIRDLHIAEIVEDVDSRDESENEEDECLWRDGIISK